MIRLQKHIADLGYCSRRKAEALITDGRVLVNGKRVTELGTKVDPETDKVKVVGLEAGSAKEFVYVILNKPVDYITSASSKQGASVMDLLTDDRQIGRHKTSLKTRVYPVGRLDKDSEGLILLTNDGELTNKLTHPRYEHEKEYEVLIDKPLTKDARVVLEKGMNIGGGERVKGIKIKKHQIRGRHTSVIVVLKEGKNRQIRKMFGRLGYKISRLRRIRLGNMNLGTLPPGRWKYITKKHIV